MASSNQWPASLGEGPHLTVGGVLTTVVSDVSQGFRVSSEKISSSSSCSASLGVKLRPLATSRTRPLGEPGSKQCRRRVLVKRLIQV